MAMRGEYIFDGYIAGRGMVRVFADMDNPRYVFAMSMKRDITWYIARSQVSPRRTHTSKNNLSSQNNKKTDRSISEVSHPTVDENTAQLSLF